jgi:hypothetical protein
VNLLNNSLSATNYILLWKWILLYNEFETFLCKEEKKFKDLNVQTFPNYSKDRKVNTTANESKNQQFQRCFRQQIF